MDPVRAVTVPVGDWLLIDATADNTVAVAAVDGDESVVAMGRLVREAGWAAGRAHPRNGEGPAGWPPADAELTVSLPMTHWEFVMAELARWAAVEESIGQTDERDASDRIVATLRARLDASS